MSNKSYGCLIALLLLGLVVSIGLNVGLFMTKLDFDVSADAGLVPGTVKPKRKLHEVTVEASKKTTQDKIAHIDLDGVISSMNMSGIFAESMPSVESTPIIATVIGGLGNLVGAVAAGFLIGAASVLMQVMLPLDARPFRDAFVYGAVIVTLLVRPNGLFAPKSAKQRV